MSEVIQRLFIPTSAEGFKPYVKPNTDMPPIAVDKLGLTLHTGDDRTRMGIPFTGENTFMIRYRDRQGAFSSVELEGADLRVLQLQGAKQEGFRVDAGLYWISLFADQMIQIAEHPESGIERLTMPIPVLIKGLDTALEVALTRQTLSMSALRRYEEFAARAKMQRSDQERSFVRDVRR